MIRTAIPGLGRDHLGSGGASPVSSQPSGRGSSAARLTSTRRAELACTSNPPLQTVREPRRAGAVKVRDSGHKICEALEANQGEGKHADFPSRGCRGVARTCSSCRRSRRVNGRRRLRRRRGEQPEGVAVDKRGDVYVSLAPLGQVWRIDRDGTETMLRRSCLPPPVTASSAWLSTHRERVRRSRDVRSRDLGRLQDRPRRVICTTTGNRGNRLSQRRDARQGRKRVRHRHDPRSGLARSRRWSSRCALVSIGSSRGLGDLRIRCPAWSEWHRVPAERRRRGQYRGGRLVRVEIEPDGSAGAISVLAEGLSLLGVDGIAFDVHGNVWAAVIAQSTIVQVSPSEK